MKFVNQIYKTCINIIICSQTINYFKISFWMLVVSLISGLLGYIYQIQIARLLNLSDFAIFSALMGLGAFMSSPLSTILMLVARRVAILKASNNFYELRKMFWRLNLNALFVSAALLFVIFFWLDDLQRYLKITSFHPIYLFLAYVLFSGFHQIGSGFLQGGQFYRWISVLTILGFMLKIVFSWTFIGSGQGLEGAILAIAITIIFIWALGFWAVLKKFPKENKSLHFKKHKVSILEALPLLVATVMFSAMTQLDLVLVNWYFPSEKAGLYAAASVMGKAALYISSGLVIALYPMVATNHSKKMQSSHLLFFSLTFSFLLSGGIALFYWFFGDVIIKLIFGQGYYEAGDILRWYGFAIMPMSLIVVAEHFLMAKGKNFFAWLFLLMAPIQIYLISKWHDELFNVLTIMGFCGIIFMIFGLVIMIIKKDFRF